jgi:hypothetical protein
MNFLKSIISCSLAASLLFFSSCSEDEDTNSPQVEDLTVNNTVVLGVVEINAGQDLSIIANITARIFLTIGFILSLDW